MRVTAEEGFDMIMHISKLHQLQKELHIMENLISDEDFMIILLTSLPESWDNYMTSFLGSSGNKSTIGSHELIAVLLEEDQYHKGRESSSTALHAKTRDKGKSKCSHGDNKDKEC